MTTRNFFRFDITVDIPPSVGNDLLASQNRHEITNFGIDYILASEKCSFARWTVSGLPVFIRIEWDVFWTLLSKLSDFRWFCILTLSMKLCLFKGGVIWRLSLLGVV